MDFTVMPIQRVHDALARALALHPDREAAIRTAAQSLEIPVETVREVADQTSARAAT